jgi:hypothetical protein
LVVAEKFSGPRIIYPAVTIVLLETSVNQEFVLGLNEKNLFEVVSGEVLYSDWLLGRPIGIIISKMVFSSAEYFVLPYFIMTDILTHYSPELKSQPSNQKKKDKELPAGSDFSLKFDKNTDSCKIRKLSVKQLFYH